MNPLISIIVPVYKVEQFLPRCIDSILNQTFTDFELLLIDDGSPDNSGAICDEYALKDKRIRVFHKENGGVSSARNLGLDNAQGEWITFIDADDWVKENYLTVFYNNQICDFIICGHQKFGCSNVTRTVKQHMDISIDSNLYTIWKEQLESQCFIYWYPWAKFYRNHIIQNNHIRFNTEMIYSEDFCFVLEYMSCINEYKVLASTEYQYYVATSRHDRYKMDYKTYYEHLVSQNNSLEKLEEKSCTKYISIRENIGNRFFCNFINYIKTINNYNLYKEQRLLYRLNINNLKRTNLTSVNKINKKFKILLLLPPALGFYILTYYKKRVWLK